MQRIQKNIFEKISLIKSAFCLFVLILFTIPTVSAKFISSSSVSEVARTALFDVEVTVPGEWELEGTNNIYFTLQSTSFTAEIPLNLKNKGEVDVRCSIVTFQSILGLTTVLAVAEIKAGTSEEVVILLPRTVGGFSNYKLTTIIEQID